MKNIYNAVWIALITSIMAGCTYSDQDIYYVEPIPGDSANIVVTTNLDTSELTMITDSLMFRYIVEIKGGELYFAEASIDNLTLYQHAADYDPDTVTGPYVLTDSFWIQGDLTAETGLNSMLFSLFYSSNTNSLADKLGLEATILDLEFEIMLKGGSK